MDKVLLKLRPKCEQRLSHLIRGKDNPQTGTHETMFHLIYSQLISH